MLGARGGATEAYFNVRRRRDDEGNDADESFSITCGPLAQLEDAKASDIIDCTN